jgi:hypothetical protein
LASLGLNISDYGLHSLRSGGATSAWNFGTSDRLFKAHGRWKLEMLKMDTFAKIEKPGCQLPKILVYHSFLKFLQLAFFVRVEMVTAPDNFFESLCFIYLVWVFEGHQACNMSDIAHK